MSRDGEGKKRDPKIYEQTMQVRIRGKNPLIERKPSERKDSDATVAVGFDDAGDTAKEMQAAPKLSIYDQMEQTDRTDEIRKAAAELASATAREPMVLEETRELQMQERPSEKPTERPVAKPKPKTSGKKNKPKKKKAKARNEPSDRTDRIGHPPPAKVTAVLDEDETIVAVGPPRTADDLAKAAERHKALSESDEVPTFIPAQVPQERPQAVVVKRSIPKKSDTDPEPEMDGPVPPRMTGAPGTHGAGAEVHRQMVNRIDRELPDARAPALKMLRGELSAEELRSLDETLNGDHDRGAADGSVSPKRSLEHLINERSYNSLTPKLRADLLRPIAANPRDIATIKAGIAILKTRLIERLRPHEIVRLLETFSACGSDSRASLAQLAARQLRGRSALEDRDTQDTSLIERLAQLMDGPVPNELKKRGVKRDRVVLMVLAALSSPERLSFEEESAGILSTVEYALAECSPAEYARIWSELMSRDAVASLAGDGTLNLGHRLASDPNFDRNATPLRLALQDLAQLAHPRSKKSRAGFMMPGGHGIDADVVSRALEMVYAVGFTVAAGASNARRHLERVRNDSHRAPPVFLSLLYERGERLFIFDRLEDGTVYLRAPHGRSSKRAGAFRADPRRVVVDPDLGLESIAEEDFEEWIGVALVPRL